MWYSFLKQAISRVDAENLIEQEIASLPTEVSLYNVHEIKKYLLEKFGSEENITSAINKEISKILDEFSSSGTNAPWMKPQQQTHEHFKSDSWETFYVMPDGRETPVLDSHQKFDSYLLARLGINSQSQNDLTRHLLSQLTGAMRVNYSRGAKNVTIYNGVDNLTPEQLNWLRTHSISKTQLDDRSGQESEAMTPIQSLNEFRDEPLIKELKSNYDRISNTVDLLNNYLGKVTTKFHSAYNVEYTVENPKNLPVELAKKLADVKTDLDDASYAFYKLMQIINEDYD